MKVTENASKDTFELLRLAFTYDPEMLDSVKKEVKYSILTGSSKWSAKIDIEVVEAQGLTGKDKSGTSDPYVTVQVGKVKNKTNTIPQDLNPKWNEKFSFDCTNSSDRIKVRSDHLILSWSHNSLPICSYSLTHTFLLIHY